ncbi:elongation factor tu GTP binding domain-containing protein [Trichoderma breve]|uniref:Elongation factor 1 alpha-like protein n=1 Tax=Trichoderma breve TaxID=2034170 RepID=A0A9W9E6T5_9HYPO|nr:elongation factor tu GTP binding domain-containing protein [Trichoderma breve]KAJ4858667.1 elongation factor tu GTP binding domain-containing protein [Trichoderma breve]
MAPPTYDDDDFVDQYDDLGEEEDELSPEDKIAMQNGTAEVRKALGVEAGKVTVAQIQEALWHYYYDIDKSVAYLTKTFIAPAPKPAPKKAPEDDESLGHNAYTTTICDIHRLACAFPIIEKPQISPTFFDDMPWLDIPRDRETVFIEPLRPRGGLLGGSGAAPKVSKLQALAALRKKKNEEKKAQEKAVPLESEVTKLSISDTNKENIAQERATTSDNTGNSLGEDTSLPTITEYKPDVDIKSEEAKPVIGHSHAPSAFARTLFGSVSEADETRRRDVFAMPYTQSPSFLANAFSEPSPDDIVLAARAKAKAPKKSQKSEEASKEAGLASSVSSLKVSDAPPPKSKGLDVLKEFEQSASKKNASFVVVGHVDAGKSTLMGRLLLELKLVEERTVDKYRRQAEKTGKQSFALAWVMDQRSEERDRGVTIDIATNHFETESTKFTILDAPGHRDFVPNMIAGASQADFAILVIDANTGAYEKGLKGQTREHVLLLRSLGVQRLIVAVNKLDMVGWSQDRFQEISEEVSGFLTGLGFQEKSVTFIPISGLNGDNIVKRTEDAAGAWYKGPTLIEGLEASGPSTVRSLKKPFRMAISEIFRSQQGTTTLAGRIDSGTIQVGDALLVQPSGESAYIKSIMLDTEAKDWAVAGQNVSVALTNIDPIHIKIGDIICHTTDPIAIGDTFTMKAMAFEHLMPMPVDLHRGRLHAAGQIQSIAALLDKATGEVIKKKPKVVQPGGVARVLIKLEAKVPLEPGQRVVIRSGGETIAAGLLE